MVEEFGTAVLAAVGLIAIGSIWEPARAVALFLGLYAIEQILFRAYGPVFQSWQVNVAIGTTCMLAVIASLARNGWPKIDWLQYLLLFLLLLIAAVSTQWTRAPQAAAFAMEHFLPEALLASVVGSFLIRNANDVARLVWPLIMLCVATALFLLVAKVPGVGGRSLIVEGGTVLSPAKLLGLGLIALMVTSDTLVRIPVFVRLIAAAVIGIALFILGARGQFLGAVAIGIILGFMTGVLGRLALYAVTASAILYIVINAFVIETSSAIQMISGAGQRYEGTAFSNDLEGRLQMFLDCFSFERPILGHGLLDWGYRATNRDVYLYPHNSIAQLYYELGTVGLLLFLGLLARAGASAKKLLKMTASGSRTHHAALVIVGFLAYDFLLSQKEGTFMSALVFYTAAFALVSLKRHRETA